MWVCGCLHSEVSVCSQSQISTSKLYTIIKSEDILSYKNHGGTHLLPMEIWGRECGFPIAKAFLGTHPGLVPRLSLCPAPVGDVLVLRFDFCDDAVHVQAAVVVHGQDDRGVRDLGLHLRQLLQKQRAFW